ncbi:MAG: 50S ribosomal protein L25 [bacterium]|nr:50S ribosomal protein L25 [bacterium]
MIQLAAQKREVTGKKVEALRKEGFIPAVLYGPGSDPVVLSVAKKEFDVAYKEVGESSLISLGVAKENKLVLIRGVQHHPLSDFAIHIDFYQPKLDEKIKIMVPVHLDGEADAVKSFEGTLIQNIHEVEVSALPQDLPSEITVDVSVLKTLEDRILVSDLPVHAKVEILSDPEWIVAQVVHEEIVEEVASPAEDEAAAVAAIEKVEGKKKEEGEAPAEEQKS